MGTADLQMIFEQELRASQSQSPLTERQRIFCLLSAAISLNYKNEAKLFFKMGLEKGIDSALLEELTLQCYLFAGFPAAIEGLIALRESLQEEGVGREETKKDQRSRDEIRADGLKLCQKVYSENFDRLMEHMEALSKDLSEWMIEEGYGKVLSRPLINPVERELATVSALSALQMTHQLHAHIRGALNVGAKTEAVAAAISVLKPLIGIPPVLKALTTLEKVHSGRRGS